MKKRMLTMLLALVMILSALPFAAMAAETPCDHLSHGYYLETSESTCKVQGAVHFICKNCGKNCQTQIKPLAAHAYGKDGKCKVCGIACEHTFGPVVTVPATCTAAGGKTETCTKCGYIKVGKTVKPAGHKFTVEVTAVAATCTYDGHTTYKTCSVCGEKNSEYAVVAAKGHVMETVTDKAATCTKDGVLEQKCKNCEYVTSETRKKTGHSLVDVAAADPTCTEKGHSAYKQCVRCPYTKGYMATSPVSHTYKNGLCQTCGIPATDYSGPETPPDPSCSHTSQSTYETDPTCTTVGYVVKSCDACHVELDRDIIPATGHDNKTVILEPTCTNDGFEKVACKICGTTESFTVLHCYGHSFANGICTVCGAADTNKYTHDFQDVYIVG